MTVFATTVQWILGFFAIISSLGVILAPKPVQASLSFLLTLLLLAALYLQLSAEFIAVMQVLVYAGAILVIFMFVVILFQDAHQQIARFKAASSPYLLAAAGAAFLLMAFLFLKLVSNLPPAEQAPPEGFGTVESLGKILYVDFFFPFEAVILIFLVSFIGALYIGKREK